MTWFCYKNAVLALVQPRCSVSVAHGPIRVHKQTPAAAADHDQAVRGQGAAAEAAAEAATAVVVAAARAAVVAGSGSSGVFALPIDGHRPSLLAFASATFLT